MAVEKQKVIARLKALFPKANLSQKRLDAYADKLAKKPADDADDAAIDAIINDFNEVIDFVGVAQEDDRVRTLENKPTPTPVPVPTPTPNPVPTEEVPSWAKALLDSNKKLTDDLEAMKTGKIAETKKTTASEMFAKSEVLKAMKPELQAKWINRIDINSETTFEDQIKDLESEYSELVQNNADSNSYAGPAGGGSSTNKPDQVMVDEIVNNLNI